jgi:hypothetical protein
MFDRATFGALAVAAAILAPASAFAFDDSKYLDLSGQWVAVRVPVGGQPAFDPNKAWGHAQQAPLTSEYEKVLDASLADQASGGQGYWPTGNRCLPPGMPTMMTLYRPMELVVLPDVTYMLIDHAHDSHRRIFTDGRDWPAKVEASFMGYSIGRWIDQNHDGHFNVLEVETRHLKGPRALDPAGMPTHADERSIIKERFFYDAANPKLLHDEITLFDHAFTRPWTVLKTYRRNEGTNLQWPEDNCMSDNELVNIGSETYYRAYDGNLMPTRKDQPPPDLKYFTKTKN